MSLDDDDNVQSMAKASIIFTFFFQLSQKVLVIMLMMHKTPNCLPACALSFILLLVLLSREESRDDTTIKTGHVFHFESRNISVPTARFEIQKLSTVSHCISFFFVWNRPIQTKREKLLLARPFLFKVLNSCWMRIMKLTEKLKRR